jgi:hypothetical protein
MRKEIFLLFACIAACNAIWLYTADVYNLSYQLYAIDTTTYRVYTIGKVRDSDGDFFTVGGMNYDSTMNTLYAIGNSRTTNPAKWAGIFAINPATAEGAFYNIIVPIL